MFRLSEIPEHSPGELHFRLFGMPVRVHPLFWIYSLFMASNRETGQAIIWTLVVFVSVLIHELGHGLAMRLFGERAEIVLYTWGGLAFPVLGRQLKPAANIFVSFAGPLAGFAFAAVGVLLVLALGGALQFSLQYFILPTLHATFPLPLRLESGSPAERFAYVYQSCLFNDWLWVNISWGLLNLFPIYPLDGGQICRTLLGLRRLRLSLSISVAVAALFAVGALLIQSIFIFAFFGLLAAGSAQALEELPKRNTGPSRLR